MSRAGTEDINDVRCGFYNEASNTDATTNQHSVRSTSMPVQQKKNVRGNDELNEDAGNEHLQIERGRHGGRNSVKSIHT